MSLYTLFEILAYLVAATILGFGIGRLTRAAPAARADADDDALGTARDERDAAQAEALAASNQLKERQVELDALVAEVAALKRTSAMTQRFFPDGPAESVEDPAGTLDAWPPPDEAEAEALAKGGADSQLQVMVAHLRSKLFEATKEARVAVEEREALAVELKAVKKNRDAHLDAEARWQVDLAEKEAELEAMRERLNAAAREIDDDHEQVSRLDERLAEALKQVEALEADARQLTDERDAAQEWGETLAAGMADLKAKIDAWEQRRAELEAAFDAFRAPITVAEPEVLPPPPEAEEEEAEASAPS